MPVHILYEQWLGSRPVFYIRTLSSSIRNCGLAVPFDLKTYTILRIIKKIVTSRVRNGWRPIVPDWV